MAFKIANRTRETTSTTGTVDVGTSIALTGVTDGDKQTFLTSVGDTNTTIATIVSGNNWLQFDGTVHTSGPTIHVDSIIASSAGGAAITVASGARVFGIIPADFTFLFNKIGVGDTTKFLRGDGTFAVPPDTGITALTGDVTASGSGSQIATIAGHAVTNAKAAQMAGHSFKGNNTGSLADSLDLTATQLTAELNVVVGDSGSGGTKGLVPAPAAGDAAANKFFSAGGVYAVPAGAITTLNSLTDVTITSVSDKQHIRWDSGTSQFVNVSDGFFSSLLVESANVANGTTGAIDNYVDTQNPATAFPIMAVRQYRGTKASKAAVQTGTVLGAYVFDGYDSTNPVLGAAIQAIATENWSGSARGTKITIAITPNGSTTQTFPLTLDQDGTLSINSGLVFTQSTAPYPFAFSSPQSTVYTASQVIGAHRMSCAGQIPANFANYGGMATTAGGAALATGTVVISIERSVAATPLTFTQIGTITIGAGTAGVSAKATAGGAAITLAADDIIRAVMPSSPDATFVGAMVTIVARRT